MLKEGKGEVRGKNEKIVVGGGNAINTALAGCFPKQEGRAKGREGVKS